MWQTVTALIVVINKNIEEILKNETLLNLIPKLSNLRTFWCMPVFEYIENLLTNNYNFSISSKYRSFLMARIPSNVLFQPLVHHGNLVMICWQNKSSLDSLPWLPLALSCLSQINFLRSYLYFWTPRWSTEHIDWILVSTTSLSSTYQGHHAFLTPA